MAGFIFIELQCYAVGVSGAGTFLGGDVLKGTPPISREIASYLQASFMMYTGRVCNSTNGNESKSFWCNVLFQCLVYLSISNLIMWGMDVFVKGKNSDMEFVMAYYYGSQTWAQLIQIIFL